LDWTDGRPGGYTLQGTGEQIMKNILTLIGALVVGFGGAGWYLGWYKLNVTKGSDGNPEIKTTVDTKKVIEDSGEAIKKTGAFIGQQIEKSANDAKTPAGTPGPATTPGNVTSVFWPTGNTATAAENKKGVPLVLPTNR
jgi:hypothetical protein